MSELGRSPVDGAFRSLARRLRGDGAGDQESNSDPAFDQNPARVVAPEPAYALPAPLDRDRPGVCALKLGVFDQGLYVQTLYLATAWEAIPSRLRPAGAVHLPGLGIVQVIERRIDWRGLPPLGGIAPEAG